MEISQYIELKKKIKNTRHIDSARGSISVEVASGTVITTPNGDIIDASRIGIFPLELQKKQKAKAKYEKKMKNRGTLKK